MRIWVLFFGVMQIIYWLEVPLLLAFKKKVAQSGMTYLAISADARQSAMGDAATASVLGVNGVFYNPAVLADIPTFAFGMNQVNWLINTKLYSLAGAGRIGRWGTVALDLVYMDYGKFTRTWPVSTSEDPRGFKILGDFSVEDYAFGLSYAYRISDRFACGVKVKYIHEDLGTAPIMTIVNTNQISVDRNWQIDHWGMDFGTIYYTGFKSLAVAMSLRNFSTDMKYWYEDFQLPLCLRIGLAMDLVALTPAYHDDWALNVAIDATHPNDYTERIHLGTELVYLKHYALRAGYQFNHDVETYALGLGILFRVDDLTANLDYAFTGARYLQDIHRFSIQFSF